MVLGAMAGGIDGVCHLRNAASHASFVLNSNIVAIYCPKNFSCPFGTFSPAHPTETTNDVARMVAAIEAELATTDAKESLPFFCFLSTQVSLFIFFNRRCPEFNVIPCYTTHILQCGNNCLCRISGGKDCLKIRQTFRAFQYFRDGHA